MAQGVSRHKDDGQGDRHHFDNQRSFIAVQVVFVTIELTAVRLDVLLLEKGMWGRQPLAAGTPLSICFHCADNGERVAVDAMARAWAAAMSSVQLAFVSDGGKHYAVLAAGGQRVILSVLPFA